MDDDFSMAVLLSSAHIAWAWFRSSTLETRLRYTPTSVFMTFPWPDEGDHDHRDGVARLCRQLLDRRSQVCAADNVGLTMLYNTVDDGAWADLKVLHRHLDEAVVACYGWPAAVAQDDVELVRRLSDLNRQIATGERPYEPFGYLPPNP